MLASRRNQMVWGILGAAAAAWFAVWMLFFPDLVKPYFAWDVHPRYAQAFVGAGYIFRTAFFLNAAREQDWRKLRWILWGNLAFTGTLLFATYWHLQEFHWNPFETPLAHIWIVLYVFEPVTMLYLSILFIWGNPAFLPVLSGYFGLLLMGGGFVAIGLFISSLTNNQMVAGVASFVVFLLLWIINWAADGAAPWISSLLHYLSITEHFDDFAKGVIDTKHIIFYLSFIAFGLFLAIKSVDSDRWRG